MTEAERITKPEPWGKPLTSEAFDGFCEVAIVCMATLLILVIQGLWLAR